MVKRVEQGNIPQPQENTKTAVPGLSNLAQTMNNFMNQTGHDLLGSGHHTYSKGLNTLTTRKVEKKTH